MDPNITALERAFELAESGRYSTTTDIKKALAHEGYSTDQITGTVLLRQIREIMAASQSESSP